MPSLPVDPIQLSVSPGCERIRLGVDLGGTKTEAAVLRWRAPSGNAPPERYEVLARKRVPTERDRGYDHIVANTKALIETTAREAGLSEPVPIGVGMPGSARETAAGPVVKNSNTVCLNGRPFFGDLQRQLGRPIAFANDANCFALAEAVFGAGGGSAVVFGVILGTGVGGGIAVRLGGGAVRVWDGAQGIAGEWGHVPLDPQSGPPCYCGRRGCVEQYLSGPAIERDYLRRSDRSATVAEIASRRPSDAAADATLAGAMGKFGQAMATVVNILDPDTVVLGGGVSHLDCLLTEGVAAMRAWVFNDEVQTRVVRHALSDSAGVVGAALLPG